MGSAVIWRLYCAHGPDIDISSVSSRPHGDVVVKGMGVAYEFPMDLGGGKEERGEKGDEEGGLHVCE